MKEEIVAGDGDLLTMFKREVARIAPLGRDEELDLARRARSGDHGAAGRLIGANLRFVFKIAFQYWRPPLTIMDLVADGYWGLMIAARRFDPERGVRFFTYAEHWVAQRIRLAVKAHGRHCLCSLDAPAYLDDNETTIKDLLPDEKAMPDDVVSERQVELMLSCLTVREREIIVLRFWDDIDLDEIGRRLGVSGCRVQQIMTRSLSKMRWVHRGTFGADHAATIPLTGRAVVAP